MLGGMQITMPLMERKDAETISWEQKGVLRLQGWRKGARRKRTERLGTPMESGVRENPRREAAGGRDTLEEVAADADDVGEGGHHEVENI